MTRFRENRLEKSMNLLRVSPRDITADPRLCITHTHTHIHILCTILYTRSCTELFRLSARARILEARQWQWHWFVRSFSASTTFVLYLLAAIQRADYMSGRAGRDYRETLSRDRDCSASLWFVRGCLFMRIIVHSGIYIVQRSERERGWGWGFATR